jgi:metal-dependent amidase/aminoacylase/carboxypeptidase family protein
VPGVFVMLGTKNEKKGYIHPLHSCYFQFDESVLIKGVELYQTILSMMNDK